MKFYYNGKLIRTSKTHDYKFAAMIDGTCLKCSATKEGAQAEITRLIRDRELNIEAEKNAIKAIERGETMFKGRGGHWIKIDPEWHTVENLTKWIECNTQALYNIKANAEVVELEARP